MTYVPDTGMSTMELSLHDKKRERLPPLSATTGHVVQLLQTTTDAPPAGIQVQLVWSFARCRSVALKTFHAASPRTLNEDPCRRLIAYEVLCMDRIIPHPNVVRLLEVKKISPCEVYLVMEAAAASRGSLMKTIVAAPEGR